MTNQPSIYPFLWFSNEAEAAANFYTSVFENSKLGNVMRNGDAVLVADFWLNGQRFAAINGGPEFRINPSISFYVVCTTEAETDATWQQLSEGGQVLMPLGRYDWSPKYGWVQDRFGVSWQVSQGRLEDVGGQKFTPVLMYCGAQQGRAEEAIRVYTELFQGSSVTGILKYAAGEPGPQGQVKHAQFKLLDRVLMAMDSGVEQPFSFNEAVSLVIDCDTQEEVDYFWNGLTADGGEESQCGWLKDKFGVSWQVVPKALIRLLSDPDPGVAQRAQSAMMRMRKIEIAKLTESATDTEATIMVETTVKAPVEQVWQYWTGDEHVTQWNQASDDWHTPQAQSDLRPGGSFVYTMAARDGSMSFDFAGTYDDVFENRHISYTMADGRQVTVTFEPLDGGTHVVEVFNPENMNPLEMQRAGWQAILDNFKKYVEGKG